MTPKDPRRAQANGNGAGVMLADRYRLEEHIASGGMGEVWRATDTLLQRSVAVKLLRESLAEDAVVAERFRREALLAAQISHPNMAAVLDYVHTGGRTGIVMEFVDGETLADRLARDGTLAFGEADRIGSGLLSALQSAHDAGIVHRDVKPGNVMLTRAGDVKVTDFGIARATSDHTLTETGTVIGTAHYLSPEQVAGKPATAASDLYSAGAVLYEMLAGRKPFEAETSIAVAMKRLTEDPAPLKSLRPDVPASVAGVVARALAREPSDRYASADEMRKELDAAFVAGRPQTRPHRVGLTPTEVLPLEEMGTAVIGVPPVAPSAPSSEETGEAPAAVVVERRKREYRRLVIYLALIAAVVALLTLGVLALTGGGTRVVDVPSFKGITIQQARSRAAELGLKITEVPRNSSLPAGRVTGQSIPAGTPVASGAPITLGVSTGNPPGPQQGEVPGVIGKDEEEASAVLKMAGFEVKVSETPTSDFDPGTVIGQYPAPGDMAQPGDPVTIFVATEPKRHGKGRGNEG